MNARYLCVHEYGDAEEHADHHSTELPAIMNNPDAEAIGRAFAHPHEIVHLIHNAIDEADAIRRIAALLDVDGNAVATILDQPLRQMLPERRAVLVAPAD